MKPIDNLSDDEWLQLVQRAAALPDAPQPWVRAAIDLWRAPSSAPSSAPTLRRLLVAVLTFDSWAAPVLVPGMRALPSDVRHLLYSAGSHDIDVRIGPATGRYEVVGQVLGPDAAGRVELVPDDTLQQAKVVDVDDSGEFRFDEVPRGSYRLTLHVGHDEISLPPLQVGAARGLGAS